MSSLLHLLRYYIKIDVLHFSLSFRSTFNLYSSNLFAACTKKSNSFSTFWRWLTCLYYWLQSKMHTSITDKAIIVSQVFEFFFSNELALFQFRLNIKQVKHLNLVDVRVTDEGECWKGCFSLNYEKITCITQRCRLRNQWTKLISF